jgi:hypothetical protein
MTTIETAVRRQTGSEIATVKTDMATAQPVSDSSRAIPPVRVKSGQIFRMDRPIFLQQSRIVDISRVRIAYEQLTGRGTVLYRIVNRGAWSITVDVTSPFGLLDVVMVNADGDVVGVASVGRNSKWQKRSDQTPFCFVSIANRTSRDIEFVVSRDAILPRRSSQPSTSATSNILAQPHILHA